MYTYFGDRLTLFSRNRPAKEHGTAETKPAKGKHDVGREVRQVQHNDGERSDSDSNPEPDVCAPVPRGQSLQRKSLDLGEKRWMVLFKHVVRGCCTTRTKTVPTRATKNYSAPMLCGNSYLPISQRRFRGRCRSGQIWQQLEPESQQLRPT